MLEIYKILFFLVLGAVLILIIFPRTKTNNVQGDLIEDQKVKDNSKTKDNRKRKGLFRRIFKTKEERKANKIKRDLRKSK